LPPIDSLIRDAIRSGLVEAVGSSRIIWPSGASNITLTDYLNATSAKLELSFYE